MGLECIIFSIDVRWHINPGPHNNHHGMPLELWVLQGGTLTLKTTDTTLVSVDGNIGHRGALVPLPHASPETITEETPSATVTLTQSHGRGKARQSSGPSPGTGVCHCSVAILKLQACAKHCTLCLYLFGVFYNSGLRRPSF